MNTQNRIKTILLIKKLKRNPAFAKKIQIDWDIKGREENTTNKKEDV